MPNGLAEGAVMGCPPKDEVRDAAMLLRVNVATVHRRLAQLKSSNQVSVLLRKKRGMKAGDVLIDAAVEEIIQEEIEQSYQTDLHLSAKAVVHRIFLRCR